MSSNPGRGTLAAALPESGTPVQFPFPADRRDVNPSGLDTEPPIAKIVPRVQTIHGETRIDNYDWLRDRSNPEVLAYLAAENRYTCAVMRHTEGLQEQLYREMCGRIRHTDLSVPERIDDSWYYSRTEAGCQYSIFCRRRGAPDGPEEILLDQNVISAGLPYFRLGAIEVSPDQRFLAFAVDSSGGEEFTLFIKDLATGELLAERIARTLGAAWANDSHTLFYTGLDERRRPCRLYRHILGTSPSEDVLVHFEPDESYFVDVSRTRSRRYLLLEISSHTTSEVWFADADHPDLPFQLIQRRTPGLEYTVAHHGDRFFIVTNDGAPNFRLVETPVVSPSRQHWSPALPCRPEVKLDFADAFRSHLVIYEREAGLPRIRVLDLPCKTEHQILFPESAYTVRPHANPEFDSTVLRFTYTSLVTPSAVVDYDMTSRCWTVCKQTEVRGGYDPGRYRTERRFAIAPDGTQVPISLVYRAPLTQDGSRPLLLSGYGAYGLSYDPAFSSNLLCLLDRGFVLAIAHVRGGEELGRPWYDSGRLFHKRSSFTDFISAAEHLVDSGYTSPERLVISGTSAGGLLVAAAMNLRPELFAVVLAEVPFVDVVNTMLDASLPLTVIEYDEWGNPHDPDAYSYIRSYSPYDNIESRDYPHILVTAGLHDTRVAYWEPAKWTAKLRARKTDGRRLLLRTNMRAGHGGASGRYNTLREAAFNYAFILDVLGMGDLPEGGAGPAAG